MTGAAIVTENTAYRQNDTHDAGLTHSFERALAVQLLESQALRTFALGVIFAIASIFIVILAVNFYLSYGLAAARVPILRPSWWVWCSAVAAARVESSR